MDKTLVPSILTIALLFGIFETSGIDLWVQDHLYDFHTRTWLIGSRDFWPRAILYTGAKTLVWVVGLTALALATLPDRRRARLNRLRIRRVDLWVLVATLAVAPLLIASSKAVTNIFTPKQIRRYGGFAPYVKPCESYPIHDKPQKRGRAFPAGHASGGFALMALAGLAASRRRRIHGVMVGMVFGCPMGFYQMANGNHYLSHTLYTALICWIVFLLARIMLARCQHFGTSQGRQHE